MTPHLDLRMAPWSPYSRREPSEYACESCGGKNLQPKQTMKDTDPDAKTDAWTLESPSVYYKDELWSIRCGGACMPEYHITAHTIEQAVAELVKQVTRDAIEDEAREWQNDTAQAPDGLEKLYENTSKTPNNRLMGQYTQLVLGVDLKSTTPPEVIEMLLFMMGKSNPEMEPSINHPLFQTDGWRGMLIGGCDYFPGLTASDIRFDRRSGTWKLSIRSCLKNYDQGIQKFCHWIGQYTEDLHPKRISGYSLSEEDEEIRIIRI